MNRVHLIRLTAVMATLTLFCVGASGVASAKGHHHHKGAGSGSAGTPAPASMTIQLDPNPSTETAYSVVLPVVQVETSPAFAGDVVNISSSQLYASCGEVQFISFQGNVYNTSSSNMVLDNEGNATLDVQAFDCAPGSDIFEASLAVAPYYTATTTLQIAPPAVTTPGVFGYPTSSGTATGGEVETGDTTATGESEVYAAFYVETDPVYAEQNVTISSPELVARCAFTQWVNIPGVVVTDGATATATLDDDGNGVFIFFGYSCAAGSSVVTADVDAGTHTTYTTTFSILPPQPTI